jgi:hypothetical protein
MSKRHTLCLSIALATAVWLAASWSSPTAAQVPKEPPREKWEYTSVTGLNAASFNELGSEGWELCVSAKENPQAVPYFVFKRRVR